MPRIKEIEILHKRQSHKFVIWYNEKEGFHVRNGVNQDMLDRVKGTLIDSAKYNYHPGKGETVEKVRAQLQEFVALYWKAVEASKRVILLSAEFSNKVMKNYEVVTCGSWQKEKEDEDTSYRLTENGQRNPVYDNKRIPSHSHGSDNSLMIEFEWLVADMVIGAETSIIQMQRNKKGDWVKCGSTFTTNMHNKDKYVVIDYTEEREAFFTNLEQQFKLMADKIAGFIGKSDEEITALVDSKKLALL